MAMEMKYLDCILVPLAILTMVVYHIRLLYRIIKDPNNTIIGVNAISRRFWVHSMMETLRNNIMASTVLASTAIMLIFLTALMMTSGAGENSAWLDFGDRSQQAFSIKYFSILLCFMAVFLLNIQSIRYYSQASILINLLYSKMYADQRHHGLTVEYVANTLNKGCYFWSLGLSGFYFSLPLFLWIFGPIPMVFSFLILVFMHFFLNVNVGFGSDVGVLHDNRNGSGDDYYSI